ncbi:hypothetical protein ABW19_dt0209466 [Dactylella cylindrospora]|nr:hypothetical protein ABW19_dt0209466 [Dactylella cylindrospora]
MASFAQLPDELRRLLETATGTFASTATKFLDAIPNPEQHFARACEILNTVSNGSNDWRPIERTIGFKLNATFTLYWLYREYDVRMNPFVSHFVEICEAERGPPPLGSEKESQMDRLRRARCKMMLAILGSEGSKLAEISARDFFNNFDQLRLGESTDLKNFAQDEEEIPIFAWSNRSENQSGRATNGYYSNGRQKAAGTASPAPGQNKQPVFAQNYPVPQKDQTNAAFVEETLSNAHIRHLNSKEKSMLLRSIEYAGKKYQPTDPEAYKRMLDINFDILQALTVEVLKRNSDPARKALLDTILPKLNLELRSLDLINHLVVRPTRDEARASGSMSPGSETKLALMTTAERTHLLHVFIENCILQMEAPYGDMDGIPANTRRSRGPDIARKVKLLCMFITNLLTREIVTGQELYYELQNLYMEFAAFKEARELWANATGGRGIGMTGM